MKNARVIDLLVGYVEYTGTWSYDVPSSFSSQADTVLGYVEYIQPTKREIDLLVGYVEYVEPVRREADLLVGYVEYTGSSSYVTPDTARSQADVVLGYVEYTLLARREADLLLGYIEVDYFEITAEGPPLPVFRSFGPLVQMC